MRRVLTVASLGLFAFALFVACAQLAGIDEGHLAKAEPDADADADASDTNDANDANDAQRPIVPAGMVLIAVPRGGSFFIDAKETTVAEYNAVVTAGGAPTVSNCPPALSNRAAKDCSFEGVPSLMRTTDAAQPVNCVTWCEAAIYCAAKGKRLCGAIGGGSLGNNSTADPNRNEWARACGGINGDRYPYGNEFEAGACNVAEDPAGGGLAPRTSCEGSVKGLYDMGGSLAEWTNGRSVVESSDQSSVQGAAFRYDCTTPKDCTCQNLHLSYVSAHDDVGIRCCKDVDGP